MAQAVTLDLDRICGTTRLLALQNYWVYCIPEILRFLCLFFVFHLSPVVPEPRCSGVAACYRSTPIRDIVPLGTALAWPYYRHLRFHSRTLVVFLPRITESP